MSAELAGTALALFGVPALASAIYLLALAVGSAFHRPASQRPPAALRIVVLVPAHDEEQLVERCVRSLLTQDYPAELRRVVVVADNCTDGTAAVAARAGAEVLVRNDAQARGKGHALAWALSTLAGTLQVPDAIVVVDADSVADAGLLGGLAGRLAEGAEVVQAEYLVLLDQQARLSDHLASVAFLLFHRVRFRGLEVLRLPVALVGNGMAFRREVLERHVWNAFSGVEDLDYSLNLRLAGIRPAFASDARVYAPAARGRAAAGQRARWEGGRFHVIRRRLAGLAIEAVRRRSLSILAAAVDLAILPLGLLCAVVAVGTLASAAGVAAGLGPGFALALGVWGAACAGIVLYVVLGMLSAGAPKAAWLALVGAPLFVVRKLLVYARLARSFDPSTWNRTPREPAAKPSPKRFNLLGVPIDPVDMEGALRILTDSALSRSRVQACTVNLDFMVNADRDPEVGDILRRSQLNLADGAPVVWLGRVLGNRVPARVAGSDLVPLMVARASTEGLRVFFLGGEHGVVAEAATKLSSRYPGLQVAGVLEPARASLDEMDNDLIIEAINRSRADLLLVAFGHPKQEKWIARNRDRLDVPVALGVGCCFDLIAGRSKRAPVYLQRLGLEWLYRAYREPGRLARRYAGDLAWLAQALPQVASELANRGSRVPSHGCELTGPLEARDGRPG